MDKIIVNSKFFRAILSKLITKYLRDTVDVDGLLRVNRFLLDHKDGKTKIDLSVTLEASDDDVKKLFNKMEV